MWSVAEKVSRGNLSHLYRLKPSQPMSMREVEAMRNNTISLPWVRQGFTTVTTKLQHTKRLVGFIDYEKVSRDAERPVKCASVIFAPCPSSHGPTMALRRSGVRLPLSPPSSSSFWQPAVSGNRHLIYGLRVIGLKWQPQTFLPISMEGERYMSAYGKRLACRAEGRFDIIHSNTIRRFITHADENIKRGSRGSCPRGLLLSQAGL